MSTFFRLGILSASVVGLLAFAAPAAVINQYTFTGNSLAASNVNANVTASNIAGSPTVNGQPTSVIGTTVSVGYANEPSLIAARANANESGTRANVYFTFTVTANAGNVLNLDTLTFNVAQGGGTANTRDYDVRTSVDNFAASLTDVTPIPSVRPTLTPVSVDLSGPAFQGLNTITFQVRFFTPGVSQNIDFDDIALNGTVVPEPAGAAGMMVIGSAALLRRRATTR